MSLAIGTYAGPGPGSPTPGASIRKAGAARDALEAEAKLREMLISPIAAPYEGIEKIAVRVGEIVPPPDSRPIPEGRWSYDPDGYFLRYFPDGYPTTRTQIYHPENFALDTDDDGRITSIAAVGIREVNLLPVETPCDHAALRSISDARPDQAALR